MPCDASRTTLAWPLTRNIRAVSRRMLAVSFSLEKFSLEMTLMATLGGEGGGGQQDTKYAWRGTTGQCLR
jgi:hypothetical protein